MSGEERMQEKNGHSESRRVFPRSAGASDSRLCPQGPHVCRSIIRINSHKRDGLKMKHIPWQEKMRDSWNLAHLLSLIVFVQMSLTGEPEAALCCFYDDSLHCACIALALVRSLPRRHINTSVHVASVARVRDDPSSPGRRPQLAGGQRGRKRKAIPNRHDAFECFDGDANEASWRFGIAFFFRQQRFLSAAAASLFDKHGMDADGEKM